MANIRSAEQSSHGEVSGGHSSQPAPEQEGVNMRVELARHLYIVHSAEIPQKPGNMVRSPPPEPRTTKSRGMIDRSTQGQIGRMLRDAFSDVAEEPVPQRFVRLLEALEAKERKP